MACSGSVENSDFFEDDYDINRGSTALTQFDGGVSGTCAQAPFIYTVRGPRSLRRHGGDPYQVVLGDRKNI